MAKYLTRREAAEHLTDQGMPMSWKTLQKMATTGGGPAYQIFGNRALYQPPILDQWAEARLSAPRRSTSEAA
jgi:hypothetical protein